MIRPFDEVRRELSEVLTEINAIDPRLLRMISRSLHESAAGCQNEGAMCGGCAAQETVARLLETLIDASDTTRAIVASEHRRPGSA